MIDFAAYEQITEDLKDLVKKNFKMVNLGKFQMPKIRLTNEKKEISSGYYAFPDLNRMYGMCEKKYAGISKVDEMSGRMQDLYGELGKMKDQTKELMKVLDEGNKEEPEKPYYILIQDIENQMAFINQEIQETDRSARDKNITACAQLYDGLQTAITQRINRLTVFGDFETGEKVSLDKKAEMYSVITLYLDQIDELALNNGLNPEVAEKAVFAKHLFYAFYYYSMPSKLLGGRKNWEMTEKNMFLTVPVKESLASAFEIAACSYLGEKEGREQEYKAFTDYLIRKWQSHDFPNSFDSGALGLLDDGAEDRINRDSFERIFKASLKNWQDAYDILLFSYLS